MSVVLSQTGEQTGAWLAGFTQQPQAVAPWIQVLREAGFARFAKLGFPTTHNEEWRFTNVAPIARTQFSHRQAESLSVIPEPVQKLDAKDAEAHLARYATFDQDAFVALNTAFLDRVLVLRVPRGVVVEQPIEITYEVSADVTKDGPVAVHPRTLILVEEGAHCTIVETYKGEGQYLTNAVTEIVVGDRAVVDHYKVQQESLTAYHVATLQTKLGQSAAFSSHSIALGGALVRNDSNAVLAEGSDATLNGLYIVNGTQHVDNHTIIDHAMPHGTSHEVYKGILAGQSHAVFNGKIIVRKDAQKTDSKQTNKNLVLSENAVIDTKPELQIWADDVRCTHGATIGQLDSESLFYLQSRGIGKKEARSLLTYAFAQDIVDRIKVPSLRDSLEKILFEKFHEHAE
jgi:Fe-S cluster assembly protein SufD